MLRVELAVLVDRTPHALLISRRQLPTEAMLLSTTPLYTGTQGRAHACPRARTRPTLNPFPNTLRRRDGDVHTGKLWQRQHIRDRRVQLCSGLHAFHKSPQRQRDSEGGPGWHFHRLLLHHHPARDVCGRQEEPMLSAGG